MTLLERDRLRRESSILKMRAMRLRSFGDSEDQWKAIVMLRNASSMELAAFKEGPHQGDEEKIGALVEACGLYLEARDPVRAASIWSQLPRTAFTNESTLAMLDRLRDAYQDQLSLFHSAWHSLKKATGGPPDVHSLSYAQVRKLVEDYPGVPELWWAISLRATDKNEASQAKHKMVELDPALQADNAAQDAWKQIERTVVQKLTVEMHAESDARILTLDLVNKISNAVGDLIGRFVETVFGTQVELIPCGATTSSFILDIASQGLPPSAIEELDRELNNVPTRIGMRDLADLLNLLQQNGVRLSVSTIIQGTTSPTLTIDATRRKRLIRIADESPELRYVESNDVPQANELERVFRIVELVANQEEVSTESLGVTKRQVDYYRRAAKILGLLDESDRLTAAGRQVARLDEEGRLKATVVHFESSACGDAWIQWSKGKSLLDVSPDSAAPFLIECVPNLNKETATRRAQTLVAWLETLIPYHYARSSDSQQVRPSSPKARPSSPKARSSSPKARSPRHRPLPP